MKPQEGLPPNSKTKVNGAAREKVDREEPGVGVAVPTWALQANSQKPHKAAEQTAEGLY